MTISKATQTDTKNLAALAVQVWLNTYAVEGIRQTFSNYIWEELTPTRFADKLKDPTREIYKVEVDMHLIGFAEINYNSVSAIDPGLTVEIDKLYIQERFCGKHIGRQLLDHVVSILKSKAIDHMWLSVYELNERAISFYKKYGFEYAGDIFFELEEDRHRNLVMKKTII